MNPPTYRAPALTLRRTESPSDIEEAAKLYVRSGTAAFTWRPAGHFKAEDFKRFAQEEDVWLASTDKVVGVLSIFRPENFIHCLYVEPDAQRRGVGRSLVAHLRSASADPLTLKLDFPNKPAIAFYEATGWTRMTGPNDFGADETGISWARYRLD